MRQGWPDSELAIAAAYLRMPHSLAAFASALHSCLQRMGAAAPTINGACYGPLAKSREQAQR
jgi:hypothetical protein